MPREFKVAREQILPATPEQVWNAIATGGGNLGWLYPMEIEPRVGGAVSRGSATVVAWTPHRTFACRSADQNGFSTTLSYNLAPHPDGGTLLGTDIHWVHTGTPDEGWDTRADAAERHIDFYRHSLAEYLRHFAGRPAAYVRATRPDPAAPGTLTAVREALGLPVGVRAGDTVKVTLPHLAEGPVEATVDHLADAFLGLRTADALYRFYDGSPWNWPVWVGHHLFTPPAEDTTPAWEAWLAEVAP
ncbi:SRPBCC domain-containing protein [Streptomyces phaeoluteigriseus]|uniref:SRPBCC domain-containing protein n=1 Tax=Streptomyces phaeoluteigriseus TaxID=114686 RepID=A0ABY4ZCY8_9ACTN|nr:SRPBCC domain-containing protein [Streptomyces phaeoluteigriseus]USQ86893.1 SRPBCC domain-containing protein [Streptomyces phaeoluteigriseus]